MPYVKRGTVKSLGIRYQFSAYDTSGYKCQLLTLYIGDGKAPIYTCSTRMELSNKSNYEKIIKTMILNWVKLDKDIKKVRYQNG